MHSWDARYLPALAPRSLLIQKTPFGPEEEFPQGVPLTAAQEKMEAMGFNCEVIVDGSFVYHVRDDQWRREKRTRENTDYILCKRCLKEGLMVTYFETVALVLENGFVVDALYERNSLGP